MYLGSIKKDPPDLLDPRHLICSQLVLFVIASALLNEILSTIADVLAYRYCHLANTPFSPLLSFFSLLLLLTYLQGSVSGLYVKDVLSQPTISYCVHKENSKFVKNKLKTNTLLWNMSKTQIEKLYRNHWWQHQKNSSAGISVKKEDSMRNSQSHMKEKQPYIHKDMSWRYAYKAKLKSQK